MKTKRTQVLTAWLLALFFMFGTFAFTACSGTDDDGLAIPSYFSCKSESDKNLTIYVAVDFGYGNGILDDDGNVTFPPRTHPQLPPHVKIKDEYLINGENGEEFFTVTNIGSFAGLTNLISIETPASVTEIKDYAFSSCINLKRVSFSADIGFLIIGREAFNGCTKLSTIEIPAGAVVGNRAFQGWTSSQTIRLPFANQAAADAAWGTDWRQNTNASIVYLLA